MPIVVEDGVGGHCQDHDARSVSSCMPANCYLEIGKCATGFQSQFTNSCVGFLQFPQFLGNFCHSTPTLVWDDQQWCLLHQKTEKKKTLVIIGFMSMLCSWLLVTMAIYY